MKSEREQAQKSVAENRKAFHDYHILETFEAGVQLLGTEVKAIREGGINRRDSFCRLEGGEAFLLNAHIGQYRHGGSASHDAVRPRKLLLHREELNKLLGKTTTKGLTIVPLRMFFSKKGRIKISIALAKGKKSWDKRHAIAERTAEREKEQALGRRLKGMD